MFKHTGNKVYPITACFSGISRTPEVGKGGEGTDGDTELGSMASLSTFIGMGDVLLSSRMNNSNSEGTDWVSTSPDELSLKTSVRHWAATSRPSLSTPGAVSTAENNLIHSMNLMDPQIKQVWYTPMHISKNCSCMMPLLLLSKLPQRETEDHPNVRNISYLSDFW